MVDKRRHWAGCWCDSCQVKGNHMLGASRKLGPEFLEVRKPPMAQMFRAMRQILASQQKGGSS